MEGRIRMPQRVEDDPLILTETEPWMTRSFSRRWMMGLQSVPRYVWIHTGPHRFRYELAPPVHSAATDINERAEQQNALNQSGRASSRLSKKCISDFLINNLGRLKTTEENRICAICQEEMNVKQIIAILRCNHRYDVGCIRKWLMIKNECPLCRAPAILDENI